MNKDGRQRSGINEKHKKSLGYKSDTIYLCMTIHKFDITLAHPVMKRFYLFVSLFICLIPSFVSYGQTPITSVKTPPKSAETPAYAYLLTTSDLDVKVTVLNTEKTYIVHKTDDLVKIALDAGDNIIKIDPLDGGNDGYTITETADKPGNTAFKIDLAAVRNMMATQQKQEETLKKFEEERLGRFPYFNLDYVETRVIWGEASDKSIEYALLPKGTMDYKVRAELIIRFGNEASLKGMGMKKHFFDEMLGWIIGDDRTFRSLRSRIHVYSSYNSDEDYQTSISTIKIESTRENIIPTLTRLAEVLRKLEFNYETFTRQKEFFTENLEEDKSLRAKFLG